MILAPFRIVRDFRAQVSATKADAHHRYSMGFTRTGVKPNSCHTTKNQIGLRILTRRESVSDYGGEDKTGGVYCI